MASTTTTRPAVQLGVGTAVAVLAGIIGLALALAVAAAMLFSPSVGQPDNQLGYRDHGLRHPAVIAPAERYLDQGLRHPATQVAPNRYPDHGIRHPAIAPADLTRTEASDGRLDDYGLRCAANGWCSQPASRNGHR